jgi:hypothetical protein
VFAGKRHLDDNALIRRYLADRGLEALDADDEALLRHLVECPACEDRYVALQVAFDQARDEVLADAAVACSPDRMAHQRDRILRRVEAQYAGPRVLPFPAAGQSARAGQQPRVIRRWVAAAAVAGLVVGLTAGRLLHIGEPGAESTARRGPLPAASSAPARQEPVMRAVNVQPVMNEDQFLSEIELATASPRTAELRAIYALTLEETRDISRPGKD